MIVLRRTPTSNPAFVHLVQTRADADRLIHLAQTSTFLGVDLEYHSAIPTSPTPPSLGLLAHRRLVRPSSVSPSQFSRAIAKESRPSFSIPRQVVQHAAWPSLQIALPPSAVTPEERTLAGPYLEQLAECTRVFIVPLTTVSDEPWRLELVRTIFTAAQTGEPPASFIFHGAGNDLAVLRPRFKIAPPAGTVIDLQLMFNEWKDQSGPQMESTRRSSLSQVKALASEASPPRNPSLNALLAFLDLPTNPFKEKSRRTEDLVAYAAYDVDQLIPAYHALRRLLLTVPPSSKEGTPQSHGGQRRGKQKWRTTWNERRA